MQNESRIYMLCYFYHVKTVSIHLNYSQDVGARIFRPTFEKLLEAFTEDWVVVNVKINSIVSSTAYGEVYINLSKNTVDRSAYNIELLPVTSVLLAVTPIKKTRDERFLAWGCKLWILVLLKLWTESQSF